MFDTVKISNVNHLWGRLIVEELTRCGVDYFCIAPGSRSAPLAVAAAENPRAKTCVHFDERGLAYHALGYAASTGRPACVIVTSGTAVANCFPAVIEASKKKIPLIFLTADRPPELRNTGANQTIDQVKIFGDYVRFAFDMPCPSTEISPPMVLTTVDQAVYRSKASLPGPVQLNCMFREPLAPVKEKIDLTALLKPLQGWARKSGPFTRYFSAKKKLSQETLKTIADELNDIRRGIILVGKLKSKEDGALVLEIARRLKWPVFPDISSGLRLNGEDPALIPYFDQVLMDRAAVKKYAADGILHLGGRMTSKRIYDFIDDVKPGRYLMILDHALRNDPLHRVSLRVESPVGDFCKSIRGLLKSRKESGYCRKLKNVSGEVSSATDRFCAKDKAFSAPHLIRDLSELTNQKTGLFLANSMSVRLMDMFAGRNDRLFPVSANRGASGIDGTLASAAGFAKGLGGPCVLLTGDLAFLHDLNSLGLAGALKQPFVIIVLNDDGGGIFSFLPIAAFPRVSEKYFSAPHGMNFEMAGKQFNIPHTFIKTRADFSRAYCDALKNNGASILEVNFDREDNYQTIRALQKNITECLRKKGNL